MIRQVDDTMTGHFRWENDWCTRCKERTTHWFINDQTTKCAQCNQEKRKDDEGLGLGRPDAEEK